MVESAKEMPVRRDSKYPWEEWERRTLEGEVLIAKQGVDFDISATNFQVVLHTHASDVGLKEIGRAHV